MIYLIGNLFLSKRILQYLHIKEIPEWYEYFWMGLAAVFAILQIWSIFLPVNIYSLIFVVVLACISAALLLQKGVKLPKVNFKFIICTGLILFAISYFASLSSGWPDTYGYHLNAVKWSNLYKVVPGLANLHTRLGFNSSFFLFASMIDNLFLKNRSSHIALSLMTSVLLVEYFWVFIKSKNNYIKTFILLSLPIFIEGIVKSVQVSSLSYDFALLIIMFAICVELIKGDKKSIFIAVILSLMLLTIKLSGIAFALIVIIFSVYKLVSKKSELIRILIVLGLIGTILLIPYIIRNIILSGWPLYPLPLLRLNIPWAVPYPEVSEVFEVIKAWAILPGIHWHDAVEVPFVQWFPGWFLRNINVVELKIFVMTLILLIGSIFLKFITKYNIAKNTGMAACVLASFISILYIIFSAPDMRFGGIFFWIFFASVGSFFFSGLFKNNFGLEKFLILFSVLLTVYISWPPRFDGEIMLKSIRWDQSSARNQVLITPRDGSPAFKVYVPDTESCGNSDLPCTPEVNNNFKEIVPGDISKGFAPVK